MCITHGEETLEDAPGNLVPLIEDDAGRVTVSGLDRADDPVIAVADEMLFQHVTSSRSIQSKSTEWPFITFLKTVGYGQPIREQHAAVLVARSFVCVPRAVCVN